jgi:hypothetical protein
MRRDPDSPALEGGCGVSTLTMLASLLGAATAHAEPFIGQFELKTLESAPGRMEFQSQNAWSWGLPPRRGVSTPEGIDFDDNAAIRQRYALELEIGFTTSVKMRFGVEFEQQRFDQPATVAEASDFDALSFEEVGAELIAVLAHRYGDGAGLGVVAEIEGPVSGDGAKDFIFGPIVEFQSGRWFAAAIPMAVYAFGGGDETDARWDFSYAAQLAYTVSSAWQLALEAYGTLERLGGTGQPSEAAEVFGPFDQHRMGPVMYYTHTFDGIRRHAAPLRAAGLASAMLSAVEAPDTGPLSDADERESGTSLTIGLGLLEGMNEDTADHTVKLSIEVNF